LRKTDRPEMAKILLSMQDLQARALAEIRNQPGCSSVRNIAINHVTDERAENNWSLCVLSASTADANTAARAALYVQHALRHDYDLMTDRPHCTAADLCTLQKFRHQVFARRQVTFRRVGIECGDIPTPLGYTQCRRPRLLGSHDNGAWHGYRNVLERSHHFLG
jgi:hypothetical protein